MWCGVVWCGVQSNCFVRPPLLALGELVQFLRSGKFTDCCISHQKCYRTCNQTKVFCDDQFKRCLQRMCLAMWDQIGCRNKAAALHTVARSHCYEYTQAQGVACVCEHDGRVPSVATQDKGNDEL